MRARGLLPCNSKDYKEWEREIVCLYGVTCGVFGKDHVLRHLIILSSAYNMGFAEHSAP